MTTNRVLLRCSAKNQTEKFSLFQGTPAYSIQGTNTISIHPQQTSIFQLEEIHATDSFTFDAILNERTQTKTIYSEYVKPMLSDILMRNIHGTVIVSGSRRSGKSFTLFGLDSGLLNYFHEDLIIEEGKNPMKVSFSFFDMKSEKIHDLLNPKCDEVEVRERTSGEVYLKNLTEVVSYSFLHFLYIIFTFILGVLTGHGRSSRIPQIFSQWNHTSIDSSNIYRNSFHLHYDFHSI